MIPAEAVEAATDALIASKLGDHAGINSEEFVEAAMAALEAAAPHMLAECWDAAIEAHKAWAWDDENIDPLTNPYRSQP